MPKNKDSTRRSSGGGDAVDNPFARLNDDALLEIVVRLPSTPAVLSLASTSKELRVTVGAIMSNFAFVHRYLLQPPVTATAAVDSPGDDGADADQSPTTLIVVAGYGGLLLTYKQTDGRYLLRGRGAMASADRWLLVPLAPPALGTAYAGSAVFRYTVDGVKGVRRKVNIF